MNSPKMKLALLFFVGAIAGMMAMYLFKTYKLEKRDEATKIEQGTVQNNNYRNENSLDQNATTSSGGEIDELTRENIVIDYVKQNHRLPDYYITKSEARKQGWNPSQGNLCEVLPGKAIGGDKFSNREKQLPKGEQYFEADVNYNCGNRNADRIVFTKNGDVWLTHDHYKSFEKQ